jgi:3-oxoacyl-[acyl-carrier protein] reductase
VESGQPLSQHVALVTGASRGIGLAIARRLGRMGANLAICGRHPERLEPVADELRREGVQTLAMTADVRQADQVATLVERASTALGPIDILVNNAGIGLFGRFYEMSVADWDAVLDTNLKAVFLVSKAVAPEMIRRHTGHIINISSLAGKNALAGGAIYCASKWGLLGLTYCLAEDLRGYGVRVSAICPGTVATEFSPHLGKDASKMLQPDDVAHAVAALVTQSPQSFISEVVLRPTQKP